MGHRARMLRHAYIGRDLGQELWMVLESVRWVIEVNWDREMSQSLLHNKRSISGTFLTNLHLYYYVERSLINCQLT